MGNRLGREKANGFRLRYGTFLQYLLIVWLSYERFDQECIRREECRTTDTSTQTRTVHKVT